MRSKTSERHHKNFQMFVFKFNQNELIIKPVASLFCRVVNARKKALLAEKERSAKVASLPLPLPNPVQVIFPNSDNNFLNVSKS